MTIEIKKQEKGASKDKVKVAVSASTMSTKSK